MKRQFPNTFVIICLLIVLAAISTWFYPGANAQTWQVFTSLYKGFVKQAGIILFLLVIGGTFWVINEGKAINVGINAFLKWTQRMERFTLLRKIGISNIVIISIMLIFSLFGSVFGMSEETIAFVVVMIPLAISMGYDSITGICMVYLAAHVGFAGAFLNPFSLGLAQEMAGIPLFSGIEYRFWCWIILTLVAIVFVMVYASIIKRNPHRSPVYELDEYWRKRVVEQTVEEQDTVTDKGPGLWVAFVLSVVAVLLFGICYTVTSFKIAQSTFEIPYFLLIIGVLYSVVAFFAARHGSRWFVLNALMFTIVYLIVGVMGYEWFITEISGLFLALGILSGIAYGWRGNKISSQLMAGAKDILGAAVVVGLASGIIVILTDGNVLDPMLNALASSMQEVGRIGSLQCMYGIQTLINLILTSASAKAAITMPIMAPFADMMGVARQSMVLAFQFGDGFTNVITPVSGPLIAVLGIAKIPYTVWFKWAWKLVVILSAIGALLLILAPWR